MRNSTRIYGPVAPKTIIFEGIGVSSLIGLCVDDGEQAGVCLLVAGHGPYPRSTARVSRAARRVHGALSG